MSGHAQGMVLTLGLFVGGVWLVLALVDLVGAWLARREHAAQVRRYRGY